MWRLFVFLEATRRAILRVSSPDKMPGASVGRLTDRGSFSLGDETMFRLERAEYDRETQRAYVELRAPDDDGGEAITAVIFSFRTTGSLSKQEIKRDIVRKARHLLKRASAASEFA